MFFNIQIFSKSSISLSLTDPDSKSRFLSFCLKFFQGFLSSYTSKTLLPFLFHLFSFFMHFFMQFKEKFEPMKFGVFVVFKHFFQNWSMGFCCWMIVNWSLWFNLINLMIWEKLDFLGLETTQFGVFVQLSINRWNWLVWLIDLIIIFYYLTCVWSIGQLVGIFESRFSNFWVFDINSMLKPNSVFLK